MKKIELLAPAGDSDSLHAAVENGADAVYLGGRLFNARQSAGNFDIEQLKTDIHYAHVRGVNIYLTMNTLISDKELEEALNFAKEAYLAGIDSIIVQDIGLAGLLRKAIPELPLHGSTQMTVYDADGAKLLEELGFKRVVLAREVPADEIRNIIQNTALEVEMFVHGALCISYSGQCLMSSIIGGRSGNRGKCAQPCRLPYELLQKNEHSSSRSCGKGIPQYLLSPKDLCLLGSVMDIADMGVKSLKIEGRMKSPEYVAAVVGAYRKYLDNRKDKVEAQDMHDLMQVFNRGGHSEGYFHGKAGRDMMCFEKPKNWGIYLGKVLSYNAAAEMVRIKLEEDLSIGDGIEIWNGENESPGNIVSMLKGIGGNISSVTAGSIVEVGYLRGRIIKDCDVYKTSDKRLNARLTESWSGKLHRRVMLEGRVTAVSGSPIRLEVRDKDGNTTEALGTALPQKAINKALTCERLEDQLRKTGNTPFEFEKLEIELDDGLAIPVSEINEVRRQVLESIEKMHADKALAARGGKALDETFESVIKKANFSEARKRFNKHTACTNEQQTADSIKAAVSLLFYKWDKNCSYESFGADRLYLPIASMLDNAGEDVVKACKAAGQEVFVQLPSITRGKGQDLVQNAIDRANTWEVDGFLAGSLGTIHMLKGQTALKIVGDQGLNVYNSFSAEELLNMGLKGVTLSAELTLDQICSMKKSASLTFEAAVYGRLPVMTSEYCPVGAVEGGHDKKRSCKGSCSKGEYTLKDRKGIEFPVLCDSMNCKTTILNSNVLFVPDALQSLSNSGVGSFRLYIWEEEPRQVKKLVELHRELLLNPSSASRQQEDLIGKIRAQGFTKGHYYRGV